MRSHGEPEHAHVDARGIVPARRYALEERPGPADVVLIALSGEIDVAAAPALRELFEDALARGPVAVVTDLAEVTFADSSALRELLRADSALRAAGIRFVPAAPSPAIERLLELTRTRDLLDVAADVESALTQLGAAS